MQSDNEFKVPKQVLIMTSVEAEKEAVLRGINGLESFDVEVAGVGPVASAISTTIALSNKGYDLVINMGIAGGFKEIAEIGSIVVGTDSIAADLGAETAEGFQTIEELGFGTSLAIADHELVTKLKDKLKDTELIGQAAPILTLSTVTGTVETAQQLQQRYPKAAAEAMEGFGVAMAAKKKGIPFLEIRSISNIIGPRDRDSWKIKDALVSLEKTAKLVTEVV
ncbi:futalosine hydrolase [Bacillus suaedae]|uniref:Futalosine hydrolase n=1 Tax=Halalkalibacter suaedae TaxID=2822140 RepID=A0A941AQQ5_9BACI|nr:futalosine hydrolase [Bacillus suaedae]MBP3953066.1 futalosine hydrolase [Bacillus suaedae]